MKRTLVALIGAVLLLLAGCGKEAESVSMTEAYDALSGKLPEMLMMDESMLANLCGISEGDCAQVVAAVSYDGMRADEIWLIEAVSTDALDQLELLANIRLDMKKQETVDYAPEQYAVVNKAEFVRSDPYLAFIITPEAEEAAKIFKDFIADPAGSP